jgi:niacin transporter
MKGNSATRLALTGLLIAIGIAIPMIMPIKFVLEPASYTLASHVAIFIAMFISPGTAFAVALGTTIGFFLGGFPIVVVLRAASHVVFSVVGGLLFRKNSIASISALRLRLFSFLLGLIHASCEFAVVSVFYFGGNMGAAYYQQGFIWSVLLLVGLGTLIHSMVDFEIANAVTYPLRNKIAGLSAQG